MQTNMYQRQSQKLKTELKHLRMNLIQRIEHSIITVKKIKTVKIS